MELESAMYTNCLLLGLDASVIGASTSSGSPRLGLFRHSNPQLGAQLLYFILSSLRGPVQSAKDFDKVWPICDPSQSRDFRKVVQGIINELESQGLLPRSNSRVSSLATCCGPKFVELLWQLSLHALREVHTRTFVADATAKPLPAPLTDVAFQHASSLIPVTKARIALERRKFLKNAETAVQKQAMWTQLANEMTAEYRSLNAEEAFLQQEIERLKNLQGKEKSEGISWDGLVSSNGQSPPLVSKATQMWESLLSQESQHEILASGPIEDLIAHREHRYRISGSSLLSAMDQRAEARHHEPCSPSKHSDAKSDGEVDVSHQGPVCKDGSLPVVDVAEVFRRWTHALQRVNKHTLHMAKANNGEGPDILLSPSDGTDGHAESLATTLAEHKQHLTSFHVLIEQLKEVIPAIQSSIEECNEKVNSIFSSMPAVHSDEISFPSRAPSTVSTSESASDDVPDITSKISSIQLEKESPVPSPTGLPQLFSWTPCSSENSASPQKKHVLPAHSSLGNPHDRNSSISSQENESSYIQSLKRSVREAALSSSSCDSNYTEDIQSEYLNKLAPVPSPGASFHTGEGVEKSETLSRENNEPAAHTLSPLLLESSLLADGYEDLLAPLSETEAALMKN